MEKTSLQDTHKKTPRFYFSGVVEAKCVSVYDGDTAQFCFKPFEGCPISRFTCRMYGYNSAEIKSKDEEEKAKAVESRDALSRLILDKIVDLEVGRFDKYGRVLVKVFIEKQNVNEWMIEQGYGKEYFGKGDKKW